MSKLWTSLNIPKDAAILVPGCGNCDLIMQLYDSGWKNVVATDYVPEAIDRQGEILGQGREVQLLCSDLTDMDVFAPRVFDVVLEKGALDAVSLSENSSDLGKAVSEISRVLKPGGLLVSFQGVVDDKKRQEVFGNNWEGVKDGSGELEAGGFVWKRRISSLLGASPSPSESGMTMRRETSPFALRANRGDTSLFAMNKKRREQLGLEDGDDENDLDQALRNNTDDTISKIIAGSLIVTLSGLLIWGLVLPQVTDYGGDGVCVPARNGGRCPQ